MDSLFGEELGLDGSFCWVDHSEPAHPSAFVPYTRAPDNCDHRCQLQDRGFTVGRTDNINKRMIEFLRKSRPPQQAEPREAERQRGFRHMVNERMRRERQKQSYLALHSVLPRGTKNDKNTIVQTAHKQIEQLSKRHEELERRNRELEACFSSETRVVKLGGTKIRVRMANPTSGIDCMLEVFKCLQGLGLKATAIQTHFSGQELSAFLQIEDDEKIDAANVEKVIHDALLEAETKFRPNRTCEEKIDCSGYQIANCNYYYPSPPSL